MALKTFKLNIYDVLRHINLKNTSYFNGLSDSEKSSIQPLVLMRWMSDTASEAQIMYLNELVNPLIFPLLTKNGKSFDHKELLFYLLQISSPGKFTKYRWKSSTKKTPQKTSSISVVARYHNMSTHQAADTMAILTKDNILDMAIHLGDGNDTKGKIRKEWKNQ